MRFLHLLLFLLLLSSTVHAQGFNTFSNRNHPEIKWRVAETAHFKIMYPAHLAGIEKEAASIAEASYTALSRNLDVTFNRRIPIYLSDEDEVLNGFATPIGRTGYTDIWVHVNDVATGWSNRTKWLRTVLAHELAHIFHYQAVRSNIKPFDLFFGDPYPRNWMEGFAQYQTELWDGYRGDKWLRTAVLDDRLSYLDGRSIWNGRLLYASGNSQLRYFAQTYGDSTLASILKHRKKVLLGIGKVHDFQTAFKEVTDKRYDSFYDDWRRHVNVYYNTLAGQMENADSLGVDPLALPGQYMYDVQYSPDTTQIAVLAHTSIRRPVRRLYVVDVENKKTRVVAEGSIQGPVSWSPDGKKLAFARLGRGENSSLLYDLFTVEATGKRLRQITKSRRAVSPTFSPRGDQIAFIASEGPTANIFVMDLFSGNEAQMTQFTGDVQLSSVQWHPTEARLAFARFDANGNRDVALFDLASGNVTPVTDGTHDDNSPRWSPDGRFLAYTSLRDNVPNVFIYTPHTDTHHRVTNLVNGASVQDWIVQDSTFSLGSLAVIVSGSKQRDLGYRIDANRRVEAPTPVVPAAYAQWTTHRPPNQVPRVVPPSSELVLRRYKYRSLRNLKHAFSFAFPYYGSKDEWGLSAFTSWTEPLAKHTLALSVGLSIPTPEKSFAFGTYVNNQLRPTITLSGFTAFPYLKAYGNDYLIENWSGGTALVSWPLDWVSRPYTSMRLGLGASYLLRDPGTEINAGSRSVIPAARGYEAAASLTITRKRQRPYADNLIHPLDGFGWRIRMTTGLPVLEASTEFVRAEALAYTVLPGLGMNRFYVYLSGRAHEGDVLPQDRLGFSRYDDIQIVAPQLGVLTFADSDRVRGFRDFTFGNRVAFGSIEYRIPVLPSLQTRILGLVSFGATTISGFADAGYVWNDTALVNRRVGVGVEVKNVLNFGGIQVMHAGGVAQPAEEVGAIDVYEFYYRVRASIAF